ncbi:hypothetical protein Daura_40020 [Dactylosporangium aurantiacum]|uniref:Uncharacterized protein n=1 Tax=Dactylosporangium aurantiacum TaxID=35754 RepID=A0A9Q9IDZ8_9ACTN|nr:hypothetical protein [Dactylosporangium aurantiacum]MDG6101386.1 hypothetical protein [Dactylosporangium aurantiacum]UWZ52758.1 hypothetical protein Daura_40020 [Dactylosporangium aurantiacum]
MIAHWESLAALGLPLLLALVRWMRERSRFRSAERLIREARPGWKVSVSSREPQYSLEMTVEKRTGRRGLRRNRRRAARQIR